MERLTEKHFECINDFCHKTGCELYSNCPSLDRYNRLADYEDTGVEPEGIKQAFNEEALLKLASQYLKTTPERLRELAHAEQDGRLVELPCKVGDTVYCIFNAKNSIVEDRVYDFDIWSIRNGIKVRLSLENWKDYVVGEFGKDIFLTHEEAEKALEGGSHE